MLFARFIKAKLIYEYNTPILFTISIYIFAKYVKKYNDGRSKSAARHALKQSKRKKLPFKREVYSFCFFGLQIRKDRFAVKIPTKSQISARKHSQW